MLGYNFGFFLPNYFHESFVLNILSILHCEMIHLLFEISYEADGQNESRHYVGAYI